MRKQHFTYQHLVFSCEMLCFDPRGHHTKMAWIYWEQQCRLALAVMALVGSFIICSTQPPPQDHLTSLSCYLVASHCFLMDWLAAFEILAEADQISQHFVLYGFMKEWRATDIVTHRKSEFVRIDDTVIWVWQHIWQHITNNHWLKR